MAIYHFSVKVIGRSQGRSAVASAAYRAGEKLTNERDGETHDFTRKQGVKKAFILVPDNSPRWAQDRSQLWNAVEKAEKRKDAQVAREIVLALPAESTDKQREELVRDFVLEEFVKNGMVADVAIHAPGKDGDQRNHHAHIMLTTRTISTEGFGKKERSWNNKELLETWRNDWEMHLNVHMGKYHGQQRAVSAKSHEDRGLDKMPTKHMGVAATAMERRGIQTERGDANRAAMTYNLATGELTINIKEAEAELEQLEIRKAEQDKIEAKPLTAKEIQEQAEQRRLAEARQLIADKEQHDQLEADIAKSLNTTFEVYCKESPEYVKSSQQLQAIMDKHQKLWQEYQTALKGYNKTNKWLRPFKKNEYADRVNKVVEPMNKAADQLDKAEQAHTALLKRLERLWQDTLAKAKENQKKLLEPLKERLKGLTEVNFSQARFTVAQHEEKQRRAQLEKIHEHKKRQRSRDRGGISL